MRPSLQALVARLRRVRPLVLALGAVGIVLVLALVSLTTYTAIEVARFERASALRATFIYAAGQPLMPGVNIEAVDLVGTLLRLRYREINGSPTGPGQFSRDGDAWQIFARGEQDRGERQPALVRLRIKSDRIVELTRDDQPVEAAVLEPEVLAGGADRPGEEYRPVRLAEMPLRLMQAVLAAEDHRFFEHGGLDLRGLVRAVWANVRAGRVTQGGSTITQQLIKNRLLGPQRTFGRKLREAWLAAVLEWRYTKEQILEAYLNETYLGQRGSLAIRGVGAAARAYFRKEVHQLTLAEAALLAGMIRAPNSYSPVLNPDRARQRRDVVLARMRTLGSITEADYQAARRESIRLQPAPAPGQSAPYFADYTRQEIEHRLGDGFIDARGGAKVFTSLDLALQRFAETAVRRGLERLESSRPSLARKDPVERLQAALIALDPETGQIRALVGGRDYQISQFNRALLARRQPGSAFKPFVYLAALGRSRGEPAFTAATFVDDAPLTIDLGNEDWSPRNYEDRYEGRVTVRRALEQSLNAATVRIAQEVGLPTVIDTARTLGITSRLAAVPAMVLGAFEVTPLELASAYLPFANGGIHADAVTSVHAVWEEDGPVALPEVQMKPVVPPAEAYLMTSLLQGVIASGTGAAVRSQGLTAPVAGKTGTTNDGRDAWFVGYTPNLLTLVWVGFDNGEPHGLSGAQAALPIWTDFMRRALEAYPAPDFAVPAGVAFVDVDVTNGRAANRFCPVTARETFLVGTAPPPCQDHGRVGEQIVDWWRRFSDWLRR